VGGDAQDVDAAGGVLDCEERVEPVQGDRVGVEQVGRGEIRARPATSGGSSLTCASGGEYGRTTVVVTPSGRSAFALMLPTPDRCDVCEVSGCRISDINP
jgi:hypothetical protein